MALERQWESISPVLFISDGGEDGSIELSDTVNFRVKQKVKIEALSTPTIILEVKKVLSPTKLLVGPSDKNIKSRLNLTNYTVANVAKISAEEQEKVIVPKDDQYKSTYEQEPVVARRVINVDEYGNFYRIDNPMPVQLSNGSINIGTVNGELEVQLSRRDNNPDAGDIHDSVRLGNQNYELSYTANDDESKAAADVTALNKLIDIPHDDVEITQFTADGDPEVILFRENGNLKITLNLTYNADGELQRVQRIRA